MTEPSIDTRRDARLWVSILSGPLAWLIDLEASYVAVPRLCTMGHRWPLFLIAALTLALSVTGLGIGFLALRDIGPVQVGPGDRAHSRVRFMALAGTLLGAFFTLIILATTFPSFIINPCEVP